MSLNKSNFKIFSQIAGEDESGYLPSRTFTISISYNNNNKLNPFNFSIEYTIRFLALILKTILIAIMLIKMGIDILANP